VAAGARKDRVCTELGISLRTMQRWTTEETMKADARTTIDYISDLMECDFQCCTYICFSRFPCFIGI
jgi:hypothetical protein